ncbi:MAG TPA: calcium-binding protein [Nannocystaceae bacterium]|nr:calcium-binding protein [Nannocystaceae bacterium]
MMWIPVRRALVLSLSLAACTARVDDGPEEQLHGVDDREGEVCMQYLEDRSCGEAAIGVQYCGEYGELTALHWGPCVALEERECEPDETEWCDGQSKKTCRLDDGEPAWGECVFDDNGEGETPLVLVPAGEALRFEPAGTSTFAIAGECITHDWPTASTPWLAIDLDRNGSIDGGHELFGSGTAMRDGSRARDGFAALAELDANGDGMITPADPRFADLLLWSDHDGDRRSTHWEHTSLAIAGIDAIPLAHADDRECDARGNCAIERTPVAMSHGGSTQPAAIVDVHLACQ